MYTCVDPSCPVYPGANSIAGGEEAGAWSVQEVMPATCRRTSRKRRPGSTSSSSSQTNSVGACSASWNRPKNLKLKSDATKRTRTPRAARPKRRLAGSAASATTRRNAASRGCDASQACGEAAPDDGSDEEEDKEEEEEEGEEDVEEEDADGLADDDKDDDEEDGEASPSTAKRQTHISRGSTEEKASASNWAARVSLAKWFSTTVTSATGADG